MSVPPPPAESPHSASPPAAVRRHQLHPLNHAQHRHRTRAAVAPNRIRTPLRQLQRRGLRRRPIQAVPVLIDRHHHHHRHIRSHIPRRPYRLLRLRQRSHRLNNQQVSTHTRPTLHQRRNLLRKRRPRLIQTHLAQRLQPHAQRPNRPRNKRLARLLLQNLVHTLRARSSPRLY